mmetsp:Transcript_17017/g.25752  ORF Transcript_17017/g.25752 Transcript_17017/m.25752 type:complete len:222 (+) Transcript_17017:206-871(+)
MLLDMLSNEEKAAKDLDLDNPPLELRLKLRVAGGFLSLLGQAGGRRKPSPPTSVNDTKGAIPKVKSAISLGVLGDACGVHVIESSSKSSSPGFVNQNPWGDEESTLLVLSSNSSAVSGFLASWSFFSKLTSATIAAAHSSHSSCSMPLPTASSCSTTASQISELASLSDDCVMFGISSVFRFNKDDISMLDADLITRLAGACDQTLFSSESCSTIALDAAA